VTLLGTRKSSFRKSGIARRKRLLQAARTLLESRELDEISLGDVAAAAKVPKGSAYHFYADIRDLYVNLQGELEAELLTGMRAPVRRKVSDWHELVDVLTARGAAYYAKSPAARQLQIGPKTPPELKLRDRQHDVALGKIFENHFDVWFELPAVPDRSIVFFRALEIADLMFSLSVLEHGHITREMQAEASRAMCAYLGLYIPEKLARRQRGAAAK
jgi:AcrR family transcriptional regulator